MRNKYALILSSVVKCLSILAILNLGACASDPKRPDGSNVRVSSENPPKDCDQLDQVVGTSATTGNAYNNALADIKKEAASKMGNYVKIVAVSAHGSAIRGMAYRCN